MRLGTFALVLMGAAAACGVIAAMVPGEQLGLIGIGAGLATASTGTLFVRC